MPGSCGLRRVSNQSFLLQFRVTREGFSLVLGPKTHAWVLELPICLGVLRVT